MFSDEFGDGSLGVAEYCGWPCSAGYPPKGNGELRGRHMRAQRARARRRPHYPPQHDLVCVTAGSMRARNILAAAEDGGLQGGGDGGGGDGGGGAAVRARRGGLGPGLRYDAVGSTRCASLHCTDMDMMVYECIVA